MKLTKEPKKYCKYCGKQAQRDKTFDQYDEDTGQRRHIYYFCFAQHHTYFTRFVDLKKEKIK